MKLSDSAAVEVLRMQRLAVQSRLSVAAMPTTTITINGNALGIAKLEHVAREAVAQACRHVLDGIDDELHGLGVEIDC